MVAKVRPHTYNRYTSGVVDVSTQQLIEDINPSFLNHFIGVQWFSEATGTTTATPGAGEVKIEVMDDVTRRWIEITESPLEAFVPSQKINYNQNIVAVRATPSGVTTATHWRLVVVSNVESSSDDIVGRDGVPKMPVDFEGKQSFNTVFGETVVGQRGDDVSVQFQYNNNPRDVIITSTGTGTDSNSEAQAILETGTGVGSTRMESIDAIRYRPGHEVSAMFTAEFHPTPEANTRQQIGLLNDSDGVSFGYNGTEFGIFFLEGGNETFTAQTDWNLDPLDGTGKSGFTLLPDKYNIYKIAYGWLGTAPIFFSVYCGVARGWVACHVFDFVNNQDEPHLNNPSLPMAAYVERTSGTGADIQLHTSSWRAGVIQGSEEYNSSNRVFSQTVLSQTIGTTEVPILALRSKPTYQGKTNHVKCELMIVRFTTDGNKQVAFRGYKGSTLTGAAWTDVNTASSVIEYDDTASSFTGGAEGAATVLNKVDSLRSDVRGTGLIINPGETFLITGVAASATSDVSVSVRWVEYF